MKFVALAVAAAMLTACTTTSAVQLSEDNVVLTTRGNAFTAPEMVMRDVMVQSATRCEAAGYEWFVVESQQDVTSSGTFYMPAQGSAQVSGNAYSFQGTSTYTGAQVIPYSKPGMQVRVHFGRGPKPDNALVAATIIALNPTRH